VDARSQADPDVAGVADEDFVGTNPNEPRRQLDLEAEARTGAAGVKIVVA
jgi:hypothetical protein